MTQIEVYDLVLTGGRVIDPAQGIDQIADVAIRDGKIAAVAAQLPAHKARRSAAMDGYLVCPGFIDMHVHVFEWMTTFGLPPDDAGIHSGVTTVVDQGGCGAYTFHGFREFIAAQAKTDVRCFPSINAAGTLRGGLAGPMLHTPELVDVDKLVELAHEHPRLIRGFGEIHAESGAMSRWGMRVVAQAREAADRTGLPLYFHTGELFEVDETNRPDPAAMLEVALEWTRPGDLLAHVYSAMPDGVMGPRTDPSPALVAAVERGLLLDIGHGINFNFEIARRMIAAGLFPHTISSDVHGDFPTMHNDSHLDYSLIGALSKLVALGMTLGDAIAAVTVNPARVLKAEDEIGSLAIGRRADVTVLEVLPGDWSFRDGSGRELVARERHLPRWVVRDGELIRPNGRLLRDLVEPAALRAAE